MSDMSTENLLKKLSVDEKIALVAGKDMWTTVPVEHLGIPSILMTDGPHGVRKAHNNLAGQPATCFPTASALAATWDSQLLYRVGATIGREAQAQGVQVVLGPGINMKRSPLGGRNFEYYSEDPVLAADLGIAFVDGLKSEGVGASVKHYAANNQEFERMTNSSDVDEHTLHEIYLKAFRKVIQHSQPWSVMASYNKINGEYVAQSHLFLTEILRDDWGYQGIVVSDWGAAAENRVASIKAGLDLEMPGGASGNEKHLKKALANGELEERDLDRVLERLVPAIQQVAGQRRSLQVNYEEHHRLARKVASEAIVLLKNDRHVLPIEPDKGTRIALIGRFAKTPRFQGAGSSQITPTQVETLYHELVAIYGEDKVVYQDGYRENGTTTPALIEKALATTRKVDIVIVAAGLPAIYETEGMDRPTMDMPEGHTQLIAELAKTKVPVVVALTNGSAVTMPWVNDVEAIVEAWLGGQAGAGGLADMLSGRVNPSGKLAETFPVRIEDTPPYPQFPGIHGTSVYGEGMFIGYRWYDVRAIAPLFPFGFGLSYTQFQYTNLKIGDGDTTIKADGSTEIRVTVRNTGRRTGKEVVQVYAGHPSTQRVRPPHELKQFSKIELGPGEAQEVVFTLTSEDLAVYNEISHSWEVQPGVYQVYVGSSSRDLPLHGSLTITSDAPGYPTITRSSFLKDLALHPKGKRIYDLIAKQAGEAFLGEKKKASPEQEALALAIIGDLPLSRLPAIAGGAIGDDFIDAIVAYCRHANGFHPFDSLPLAKSGIGLLLKQLRK